MPGERSQWQMQLGVQSTHRLVDETDLLKRGLVQAGENRHSEQLHRPGRLVRRRESFTARRAVDREVVDAHGCGPGGRSAHGCRDVMHLQVEEALGSRPEDHLDRGWADRGEELEAYFENADMLVSLVDESRCCLEVWHIERKSDVGRRVLFRHHSPQLRYGAD